MSEAQDHPLDLSMKIKGATLRPVVAQAYQDPEVTSKHYDIQVKDGPKISQKSVGVQTQCFFCSYSCIRKKHLGVKSNKEGMLFRRHLDHHHLNLYREIKLKLKPNQNYI